MIKPTVGRKVWYIAHKSDTIGIGGMAVYGSQPLDATIVAVWGDHSINVVIFDNAGKQFVKLSVGLLQDDEKPNADMEGNPYGHCVWTPYQVGQAAEVSPKVKAAAPAAAC